MKASPNKLVVIGFVVGSLLTVAASVVPTLRAQNPEMQQRIAALKQSIAFNKQVLAQYTWMEQQIISIKGEQKREELYNVQMGPDGKPQKTPIDPSSVSDDERKRRGLRGRIIAKRTDEYEEYGNSIKTLVQQYLPPDKDVLQQCYEKGNFMIGPVAGQPGNYRVVISNYLKPSDSMTIIVDKAQFSFQSLSISTYLSDPGDGVNVNIQFSRLPNGGPFHIATETINGVSKQLTVEIIDTNYQHM
jgi:hypothetical protein